VLSIIGLVLKRGPPGPGIGLGQQIQVTALVRCLRCHPRRGEAATSVWKPLLLRSGAHLASWKKSRGPGGSEGCSADVFKELFTDGAQAGGCDEVMSVASLSGRRRAGKMSYKQREDAINKMAKNTALRGEELKRRKLQEIAKDAPLQSLWLMLDYHDTVASVEKQGDHESFEVPSCYKQYSDLTAPFQMVALCALAPHGEQWMMAMREIAYDGGKRAADELMAHLACQDFNQMLHSVNLQQIVVHLLCRANCYNVELKVPDEMKQLKGWICSGNGVGPSIGLWKLRVLKNLKLEEKMIDVWTGEIDF